MLFVVEDLHVRLPLRGGCIAVQLQQRVVFGVRLTAGLGRIHAQHQRAAFELKLRRNCSTVLLLGLSDAVGERVFALRELRNQRGCVGLSGWRRAVRRRTSRGC